MRSKLPECNLQNSLHVEHFQSDSYSIPVASNYKAYWFEYLNLHALSNSNVSHLTDFNYAW